MKSTIIELLEQLESEILKSDIEKTEKAVILYKFISFRIELTGLVYNAELESLKSCPTVNNINKLKQMSDKIDQMKNESR